MLITTPTPSTEVPAQENLLQKHKERVETLSQPDRLIKIDEFLQSTEPVTCREYTLPRDEKIN